MATLSPGFITNPNPNVLYDPIGVDRAVMARQTNALAQDEHRQLMGIRDTEYISRAAQSLWEASGGDEAKMAEMYPGAVAELQRNNIALNAPTLFPGKAQIDRLRTMGISSEKQGEIASNRQGWSQLFPTDDTGTVPAASAPAPAVVTPPAPGVVTPPAATDAPAVTPQQQSSNVRPGGSPALTSIVAPGGAKVTVAQAVAPRFQALVNDLEAAGYKLDPATTGGYNPRNIRGTNIPSHHASGNAIDINWQRNARGANTPSDIPPELARSLAAKHGLVWGGDWTGETRDPMHFEVAGATRTGGGIGERIPGAYNVAGPPVAAPGGAVAPAAGQPGRGMLQGLQPDQIQQLRALQMANRPFSEGVALLQRFRAQNAAAAQHADTTARLARAEERAGIPSGYRRDPNNPDGLTYVIGGPADPKVIAQTGRDSIPSGYMRTPDGGLTYVVGGPADPKVIAANANARGEGGRVLPSVERNLLVTHGGRLSELDRLQTQFQADYGGFKLSALGDLQNAIARNTPGESPRADWWQSYQSMKNAVRNELFGASLTPGERAEFEKADINPGMSADAIRNNLNRQTKILRQGLERRARSLVLDKHNQRSVEEASGLTLNMDEPADRKEPAASAPASRPPLSSFKR